MSAVAMLDRIADQPRALGLLRRSLGTGRVAHAYAFIGPEGSGRRRTALAFAQALLCEPGAAPAASNRTACGACRGCRMAEARAHPDLHVIEPTPPASNPKGARAIRIDAIRELERQASLRPVMGPRKVFILTDADRMTGESPQAFLKTLEEPPEHTVLILVLGRARAVPATVLSRCQLVRFHPLRRDASTEAAADGIGDPEVGTAQDAPAAAGARRGSGRGGRGPAATERGSVRAEALALLGDARERGIETVLARGDKIDRERAEAIVDAWWSWCRDLLLARAGAPAELLADADGGSEITREAERWTLDGILSAIDLCRRAREALAHNVSPRLTLEVLLSRLVLAVA
jgi:DNA polymerase III subunit delta'